MKKITRRGAFVAGASAAAPVCCMRFERGDMGGGTMGGGNERGGNKEEYEGM